MDFKRNRTFIKYMKICSQLYILYIALLYFSNDYTRQPSLWIDLTHPLRNDSVFFPGMTNFSMDIKHRGNTSKGIWFESNSFALAEHGGTHCDAPSHFAEGSLRIHQLPVERFCSEAVVIDISHKAKANPDAQLTLDDVLQFEKLHGKLPKGAYLFMHSGWDKKWYDIGEVLGNKVNYSELHFPGIHPELAYWLVSQRNINAVGVDTPSIDFGPSSQFESHRILYKAKLFGMENVKNLGKLPPTGSMVYAFPMHIHDGSGAPCRIIAALPEQNVTNLNSWFYFVIFLVSIFVMFLF